MEDNITPTKLQLMKLLHIQNLMKGFVCRVRLWFIGWITPSASSSKIMASEAHYNFFKTVHDEEKEHYANLSARANLYFTVISFFLGAIVFKFDDLQRFMRLFHIHKFAYLAVGLILAISLVFTMLAICIRRYEGICDLEKVSEEFEYATPMDGLFWKRRIGEMTVSTTRNRARNAKVAMFLRLASIGMIMAAFIQLGVFVFAIWKK